MTERHLRGLLPLVGAAIAVVGIGVLVWAAVRDRPESSSRGSPDSSSLSERRSLAGFGRARVTITSIDGKAHDWCVLLARSEEEHQRGLMQIRDRTLGGHDGMLFLFPDDQETGFWMRNTPMPLSIAYFDRGGQLVSIADMAPCADVASCPSYPPTAPYRSALEVPAAGGGLARLGVAPGGVLRVTGRCDRPRPAS